MLVMRKCLFRSQLQQSLEVYIVIRVCLTNLKSITNWALHTRDWKKGYRMVKYGPTMVRTTGVVDAGVQSCGYHVRSVRKYLPRHHSSQLKYR